MMHFIVTNLFGIRPLIIIDDLLTDVPFYYKCCYSILVNLTPLFWTLVTFDDPVDSDYSPMMILIPILLTVLHSVFWFNHWFDLPRWLTSGIIIAVTWRAGRWRFPGVTLMIFRWHLFWYHLFLLIVTTVLTTIRCCYLLCWFLLLRWRPVDWPSFICWYCWWHCCVHLLVFDCGSMAIIVVLLLKALTDLTSYYCVLAIDLILNIDVTSNVFIIG